MKILVVADEEEKRLWDFYDKERTEGVDLIISCGDLHPDYLQFLVTVVNKPLLYVRGNHDRKYDDNPPCGCDDIDDMVYDFNGLRILGLGGSMRYKPGGDMYTEEEIPAINRFSKLFGLSTERLERDMYYYYHYIYLQGKCWIPATESDGNWDRIISLRSMLKNNGDMVLQ